MSGQYRNLDRVDGSAVYGTVSVTTTTSELKVGASALTGRDYIVIQPKGNTLYIGFNSSVTAANGIAVFKDQTLSLQAGDNITVFAIASTGTIDVRIAELA